MSIKIKSDSFFSMFFFILVIYNKMAYNFTNKWTADSNQVVDGILKYTIEQDGVGPIATDVAFNTGGTVTQKTDGWNFVNSQEKNYEYFFHI